MFTVTLSVVLAITANVFTLGERIQQHSKCLSTLKDIKEAYVRGDFFPTDVEKSILNVNSIRNFQNGFDMTTIYYRVTYESQSNNISHINLDDYKKCCDPNEDDNSCLAVIVFHSPVYTALHPLLLHYFSTTRNLYALLIGQDSIAAAHFVGVTCWNLPPVCDNSTGMLERSLVFFTEQVCQIYVFVVCMCVY